MTAGDNDTKPRRTRDLNGEDHELWHHVARSVSPIRGKRRVPEREPAVPPSRPPVPPGNPIHAAPAPAATKPAKPRPPPPGKPKPAPARPASPDTLDRRKARRIAKGREKIEARIDLHGMRQTEAHLALRGFLHRCYAQGFRRVLVITGKGASAAPQEDWEYGNRERGILRRNVPRWLAEPELAAIVTATSPAHARHGGEGAIYVTLRNARRHRPDE